MSHLWNAAIHVIRAGLGAMMGLRRLAARLARTGRGLAMRAMRPLRIIAKSGLQYGMLRRSVAPEVESFRPDVVHAHDLAPLPAALHAAATVGARVVYDAHELERHRNGLRWWMAWLIGYVEWRHIRRADAVITVCGSIADWLASVYGIARPTVVMNAPNACAPEPLEHTVRDAAGVAPDTPLAVYVGKLTFNRGLDQMVEALALCPEFHLACLGPRHEPTVEKILALAGRLGVTDRLHVLESVPPHTVVSFVATADIGVVPTQDVCLSYRFSMPNKLFEMTFGGLPVVVSDLPEQRAFVERVGNGTIMDEKNPVAIAGALRDAYARRDELRPSEAQIAAAAAEYSWDVQATRLCALYESTLGVPPARTVTVTHPA